MKPILHQNETGLRMRVSRMVHSEKVGPNIVLLPMCHYADANFFWEMWWERKFGDVVIVEGASNVLGRYIRPFYKAAKFAFRQDLKAQNDWSKQKRRKRKNKHIWKRPGPNLPFETTVEVGCKCGFCESKRSVRYIRADLDDKGTKKALKKLPIWVWPLLPLVGFAAAIYGLLGSHRKDLLSGDIRHNPFEEYKERPDTVLGVLTNYALTERDNYLHATLKREIAESENHRKLIVVEYGAGHMPALIEMLVRDLGYVCKTQRSVLCVASVPPKELSDVDYSIGRAKRRYYRQYLNQKIPVSVEPQPQKNLGFEKAVVESDMEFVLPIYDTEDDLPIRSRTQLPVKEIRVSYEIEAA